jgi:hypothetical protein
MISIEVSRSNLPCNHKYGSFVAVKTTLEIPDPLFRKAKATAAARGQTLKQLVNEALRDKLAKPDTEKQPGWMKLFGAMKEHSAELRRIDTAIKNEFERIDHEDWK